MKWYHLVHLGVTLTLAVSVILLVMEVVDLRRRSETAQANPDERIDAKARLVVVRGLRPNWEYRVFEGPNVIGRADQQPVDIDLQPQEPEDRVWSSRQHAAITWEDGSMWIEDLHSSNGTYVNREIVRPGTRRALTAGDTIQIGEVHLKVVD